MRKTILSLILGSLLSMSLISCNGGGGGGNNQENYNPQPTQSNATNFFSTYSPYNNQSNNVVIQVQYSDNSKTNAVGLYLFNLSTYTPATPPEQAVANFTLSTSSIKNNYVINNSGSAVGNLKLNGNNIILNLNFSSNDPGVLGEYSTILIGTTSQLNAQAGNYLGFCFNLPTLLSNNGTNYGNDVCQYSLNQDGTFNITDLSVNQTNNQQTLCTSGTWNQSVSNPYFYNLSCIGYNGKQISMLSTFENYNNKFIMNQLVDSSISGNQNTIYVSTLFPSGSLNTFESGIQTLNQINLSSAGSSDQFTVLLSSAQMTSQMCALLGSQVGTCALNGFSTALGIPNGVKMIETPTYVSTTPVIIGSSDVGLFVDNNMYSYYF